MPYRMVFRMRQSLRVHHQSQRQMFNVKYHSRGCSRHFVDYTFCHKAAQLRMFQEQEFDRDMRRIRGVTCI